MSTSPPRRGKKSPPSKSPETEPDATARPPDWADANCRAVLEAAPDAMLVVNRTGEIVAANQEATKLYGYGREQLIGRVVESLIPARLRDRHRQHRENFFANPEMQTMQVIEIFAVRSDASEIPVDVSLRLLTIGTETFAISAIRDATARVRTEELKRAEAILRESEQRFRSVADTAPVLIWMSGSDKLCTYFNQPWLDFTGRSLESELGNGWAEGVHPEDLQRCLDTYTQSFDRREKFRMQYRLRRHDGEFRWVLDIGVPRFDPDHTFVGYIGIGVDVTERKQAEEALRASEERLRLAQQAARIGTFDWNIRTGVNTWTPELEAMYGLPPGDFGGTHAAFEGLVYEDDRARLTALVESTLRTGQPTKGEWRVVWPDGSVHWLAAYWQVLMDESGQPSRVIGVNIDVTERKAAEEALRESEERFRLVANNAPVMIWMSGLDTKPTYFNQLWLDFTGLSETDLLNGLAGIVHPEDYLQCHDVYCRGFDQRQPFRKECRLRRHDGQYRWMLDVGVPRFLKDGSFAGYIGSCIDVTDRKLAEDVLTNMSRKLVEAQEQERARIARELHDDINQRLAMLAVELEQLQDNPSEVQGRVQELRKQTTEISNDVQALSHELHSPKLEYLGVVGGVRSWCKEFSERQGIQIEFKSAEVQTSVAPEIGLCLFRVLQEALHNAAKHSGVRRIEVQLRENSGEIHLVVSDLGRGFDVETAMQGRGFGLASMQERVRLVNGTIKIQSKPMGGTTIDVRVPLSSENASQRAAG